MSQTESHPPSQGAPTRRLLKAAPVILVGSVMFTFISYWRVAAVVLCDMASTAFYIGGIVEQLIGPAAPAIILAVMLFSYAVRSVYIESCSMFVRGGVYRVVKEALGSLPAKGAVSALLFDYILTGPISSVSAGQYLTGLFLDMLALLLPGHAIHNELTQSTIRSAGSVVIAVLITLYFFRKNIIGIHESSDKALRIMYFTSIMAIIVLIWSGITLAVRGPANALTWKPDLSEKFEYETESGEDRITHEPREVWKRDSNGNFVVQRDSEGNPVPRLNPVTGHQEDPLGFLPDLFPSFAEKVRNPTSLWTFVGLIGLLIAFGHSVLAMSGEETLAQVYREVESPKLKNFEKAGFVIFIYSLILTAGTSFLAVLLIPEEVRMRFYADNLLGGLAMHVVGPAHVRLVLNALVVIAGFLILSGAVNTSIIGSNGVLNRVADDGVLPDWLQKPHPKYGTTYRMLRIIAGLQVVTIIVSRGDMILLGEAYAFGVVWSFALKAISMVVLRFQDRRPREFKVPFNISIGSFELPVGLGLITLVLTGTAIANLFTKEVATVSGLVFTAVFLTTLIVSERFTNKSRGGTAPEHLEQVSQQTTDVVSDKTVGLTLPYRKVVAVRSPEHLDVLRLTLEETDPETTEIIVVMAKTLAWGSQATPPGLDRYDQRLITAVIEMGETIGKQVKPLVVPTNNALFAIVNTASSLQAQEIVVGTSSTLTAESLLNRLAAHWTQLHEGQSCPLTIRVLDRNLEVHYDLSGGNRIPKISQPKTRSVADLREAAVGARRVLMTHDGTPSNDDILDAVLTILDPGVELALVHVPSTKPAIELPTEAGKSLTFDRQRNQRVGRDIEVHELAADTGPAIVRLIREQDYNLVIVFSCATPENQLQPPGTNWLAHVDEQAPCLVFSARLPPGAVNGAS